MCIRDRNRTAGTARSTPPTRWRPKWTMWWWRPTAACTGRSRRCASTSTRTGRPGWCCSPAAPPAPTWPCPTSPAPPSGGWSAPRRPSTRAGSSWWTPTPTTFPRRCWTGCSARVNRRWPSAPARPTRLGWRPSTRRPTTRRNRCSGRTAPC